jgi:hypothetical protein
MLGNFGIDKFASVGLECCESTFLVNPHQSAVAGNVGCEDGGQPSFDARLSHENCPGRSQFCAEFMDLAGVCPSNAMSALGQKRTLTHFLAMSALPPKADIRPRDQDVCFGPKADSCTAAINALLRTVLPNFRQQLM